MGKNTLAAGYGIAAALALGAPSTQAKATALRMTCHELLGGVPMKEPVVYEVDGPNLFRTSVDGERVIISSSLDRRYLGTAHDKRGDLLSYATHRLRGQVLERQVFDKRRGRPMRLAFSERFDFGAQRYTSSFDGARDQCHHDGR